MANGRINITELRKEIVRQGVLDAAAAQLVRERFEEEKANMIEELVQDTISQELSQDKGAFGPNLSGLLNSSTKANLFSFLGFEAGSKPVDGLKAYLISHISMNAIPIKDGLSWRFTGRVPTQDEVYRATPVHWPGASRSWVRAIEKGITGSGGSFRYYLRKDWQGKSRSGIGLQNATNIHTGKLMTVRNRDSGTRLYVTKYLDRFVKNVGTSEKQR